MHGYVLVTLKQCRSDDESCKGADIGDLAVDFQQETSQMEDEDEDVGLPPELERIIAQEDQEMRPHQEDTELVDLGADNETKEVKVGTGMTPLHP